MESIFRFLKGYLIIRISKQGFARFINLCLKAGFDLWNIEELENEIHLRISLADFINMKNTARKSKVKIKIIQRKGLPFLLFRMRPCMVFFIGILLCLGALYYQKTHIWSLTVDGNVSISEEQIADCLAENGFYAGMPCEEFYSSKTERMLRDSFDAFSWVCASLDGTVLRISVIENIVPQTDTLEQNYPSSLYAAKSGTINRLMVKQGYTEKKPGDEICEGDLLISGQIPYTNQDGTVSYHLTAAEGDYLCEITVPYYKHLAKLQTDVSYGAFEDSFGNIAIGRFVTNSLVPKKNMENSVCFREYIDLNFMSVFNLRLYYIIEKTASFQTAEREFSTDELKKILMDDLNVYLNYLQEDGAKHIEPAVSFSVEADRVILFGNIKYMDSAVTRELITSPKEGVSQDGSGNINDGVER